MGESSRSRLKVPPEQEAARARCFHPSGESFEFAKEEVDQSIPDRFERQVAKYPNRIAIRSGTFTITYDELNRMANRVARAILMRRGDGEEPIALLLERGAVLVAAMLGVLKAGKVYVPLDPGFPRARTLSLAADCGLALIVSNGQNLRLARELVKNDQELMNVDELDPSLPGENPRLCISPDALAWILYTSGSTGRPKGVVQNHRNTLNEIRRHTNSFHICRHDRLAFMAPCNVIGGILRPSHVAARQPKAVAFQQGRRKPQGVYSLPDHMIPSTYVLLEAMPLTPNGKVDRQGLPEPEKARPELQNPYAAPRTPVEEILAEIWADVIGVEQVGIHDNFFELGGDSLLATRIVSRILQHFRLEISLRSLFQLPTVAEIGTLITGH